MLSKHIKFKNFQLRNNTNKINIILKKLLREDNEIFFSLKKNYQNSFSKKLINKYKKFKNLNLIGIGGSSLGFKSIYYFLSHKIKKKVSFLDNLFIKHQFKDTQEKLNLIISKSGNTIETIVNSNIYIKKNDKNIFLTDKKNNYLTLLAKKLKSEIISHNNYIGGRFSVLSEVGMLPAELVGLDSKKFKKFDDLVKNKRFINSLTSNVSTTLNLIKKNKKVNSVIINYDEKSNNLFLWYQQLIAESLGKKYKGVLPIVSTMPKDNHSVMQLYLDGIQKNFYTFFFVHEKKSLKINNSMIFNDKTFLRNKNIIKILNAQKLATERVFIKKKIPFRSFEIFKRTEDTLGELFTFFILETILLARALNINPYDQPAVELIKKETKKILS